MLSELPVSIGLGNLFSRSRYLPEPDAVSDEILFHARLESDSDFPIWQPAEQFLRGKHALQIVFPDSPVPSVAKFQNAIVSSTGH
jgi:hypothetical protein